MDRHIHGPDIAPSLQPMWSELLKYKTLHVILVISNKAPSEVREKRKLVQKALEQPGRPASLLFSAFSHAKNTNHNNKQQGTYRAATVSSTVLSTFMFKVL